VLTSENGFDLTTYNKLGSAHAEEPRHSLLRPHARRRRREAEWGPHERERERERERGREGGRTDGAGGRGSGGGELTSHLQANRLDL